jgi:uncharacterized membrane protein (GlpM family)
MAVLQQCELLKIEDILPFFPDFVLIDDFKVHPHSQINQIKSNQINKLNESINQ